MSGLHLTIRRDALTVMPATAAAVRRLADELAATPGPSSAARAYAARRGWTTDALWVDLLGPSAPGDSQDLRVLHTEQILDNVAVERFCDGDNVRITREERVAVVRELLRRGASHHKICRRLRMSGQTLLRLLEQVSDSPRSIDDEHQQEGAA
ncbi:MAG: hypothetical protein JWM93_2464 [Frankiales bacterium]|nr:hypothetical protein [Frankiales bacterium]